MKIFALIFLGFIIFESNTNAQVVDSTTLPPYLKTRQVPPYKILKMDSSTYHFKYQLTKQTNTVVIYFNPDCEHCKIEAKNIVDSLAQFKETQFVFASYAPFKEIQQFAADYNLLLHKNIIVGRDEQYFIPRFFKVRFTPFVAVYNKDGVLLKAFEGGASVKKLLDTLE